MFTLGVIYIFIYTLITISLLIIITLSLPITFLTQQSLTFFTLSIQKYTKYKLLFFFLIFSLTGLPPVGLFFVKFNIFVFILYQTQPLLIIFLFLIFFCNMLFYIQIFNIKNFKKKIYSQVYSVLSRNWYETYALTTQSNYKLFNLIFIVNICVITITLFIFIYSDVFVLCTL